MLDSKQAELGVLACEKTLEFMEKAGPHAMLVFLTLMESILKDGVSKQIWTPQEISKAREISSLHSMLVNQSNQSLPDSRS